MTDLRTAAQQALDWLYDNDILHPTKVSEALRAALAQQEEPVQEPVAWSFEARHIDTAWGSAVSLKHPGREHKYMRNVKPLYLAPPQRQPLTEEEILKAIGWERAEMYMKLTPNFPVAEAKKETLKNARAIERAHGIGEQP